MPLRRIDYNNIVARGKHKSVPKELKHHAQWMEDQGIKIVLGLSECARHKFTPGHIKLVSETDAGIKAIGYSGNGIINMFLVCKNDDHRIVIRDKFDNRAVDKRKGSTIETMTAIETDYAQFVDHTYLAPSPAKEAIAAIKELCKEAKINNFNSICIRPEHISKFSSEYRSSAVIGFPEQVLYCSDIEDLRSFKSRIGNINLEDKKDQAKKALAEGAKELDPVIKISHLKDETYDQVQKEIEAYLEILEEHLMSLNKKFELDLKPIFSCECLNNKELEQSIRIFAETVLNWLKTKASYEANQYISFAYKNSTGFIKSNSSKFEVELATPALVTKIAQELDKYDPEQIIKIKAAGGVRSKEQARAVHQASAGRLSHIGTSSGLKLV